MRTRKFINGILAGGLFCSVLGLSSCEDYLTVLPTDQITEEDFWTSKTDVDNVRAAAYRQMCTSDVTSRILYWGELRGDNVQLNDMVQQDIMYVQQGILMPTNSMFDWSPFYTGINYCNLVLEQGDKMTQPGAEVDPSFRQNDWLPIKAEMLSLRALYYFYLVRAYRDVPYVTTAVRTDEEARARKDGQTPGVNILGKLIAQLEEAATYAADNYGNTSDNAARFTKRGVHALLADMYIWRGCMVANAIARGTSGDVVISAAGDTITGSALTTLRDSCYLKAVEHCDYILDYFLSEYQKDLAENNGQFGGSNSTVALSDYPYLTRMSSFGTRMVTDNIYSTVWTTSGSDESVFQLNFDGDKVKNDAIYTYFSYLDNGALTAGYMAAASLLTSSAGSSYNPDRGFGKGDIRLLETLDYQPTSTSGQTRIVKNLRSSLTIPNLQDVTDNTSGTVSGFWRSTRSQCFPVYRLTDVMLMKAEAIARLKPATAKAATFSGTTVTSLDNDLVEGFKLVNKIYERNNPEVKEGDADGDLVSPRLKANYAYMSSSDVKTAADLLTLVYNERQREFAAEGKRWFDVVRQCEAQNSNNLVLSDYISLSTSVRNRLRQLYSVYSPIYSEEIKVNGVEYGGNLTQNPVWDRYTTK